MFLCLAVQHREGIYWCLAPLRDKDQRSYKVRSVADVQVACNTLKFHHANSSNFVFKF
jgi:hypothetical protein